MKINVSMSTSFSLDTLVSCIYYCTHFDSLTFMFRCWKIHYQWTNYVSALILCACDLVLIFNGRLLTGQVDERTLQKYEKEAKDNNRESWIFAYIMGTFLILYIL